MLQLKDDQHLCSYHLPCHRAPFFLVGRYLQKWEPRLRWVSSSSLKVQLNGGWTLCPLHPFLPSSSSFPYSAGPSTKSCTGLMEWADQEAVLDVFVLTNHQTIYSQSMPSSFSSLLVQHMHTSHSLWSSSSLLLLLLLLFLVFLLFLSLSLSRWSGLHVQDGLL